MSQILPGTTGPTDPFGSRETGQISNQPEKKRGSLHNEGSRRDKGLGGGRPNLSVSAQEPPILPEHAPVPALAFLNPQLAHAGGVPDPLSSSSVQERRRAWGPASGAGFWPPTSSFTSALAHWVD